MPEGHKTHFLAREHHQWFAGQTVRVTSPQGRFSQDAKAIDQQTLEEVTAAGKHLFYAFEAGAILHIHLGRYGKFRQHPVPPPAPQGQIRMRLIGATSTVDLTGPTTCRVIGEDQQQEIMQRLGPDPLAGGTRKEVWEKLRTLSKPIGALLLEQDLVAGIGNIFRAEILFEAGVDPFCPGNELDPKRFQEIWKVTLRQMKAGLKWGRIVTVTAREVGIPLNQLKDHQRLRIYRQDRCPRCDHAIEKANCGGRDLYYCPMCQTKR